MIRAALHGARLGADPVRRETRSGNIMVTCHLAVDVSRGDESESLEWISVAAFAGVAESLAGQRKGDVIGISGRLFCTRFTGRDGGERTGWQLTADSIITTRGHPKSRSSSRRLPPRDLYASMHADDVEDLFLGDAR